MDISGRNKRVFITATAFLALFSVIFSASAFIADRYAARAEMLLDDPETEDLDVVNLSVDTLPAYLAAIEEYEGAAFFAPLHAGYRSSLADLYSRIDIWSETMRLMGSDGGPAQNGLAGTRMTAKRAVQEALCRDPSNVDLHLARGQQMMARGEQEDARQQLLKAASFYPINSPTRLAVATELLAMGYRGDARTQAEILARNDDSYRLDEDDPMTPVMRENRTPDYDARLTNSYLYRAMEVEWRLVAGDEKALGAIVPDNVDAHGVARNFARQRGIDGGIDGGL